MNNQPHLDRNAADTLYRNHFGAFAYPAFGVVNPGLKLRPNWHIDCASHHLQMMVTGQTAKRLVLNQPPRSLKSFIVSVCLPAWLLGRNPSSRIICASYSVDLANKFSRDCRSLMDSPFYKRIFPCTRLNPKKATEGEFETTRRGYRFTTSVGGTLTGRGGDVLIIDDPIKGNDANSVVALEGAIDWFRNTALSRLDNPGESLIIVTMQRLHVNDLSGILIESGWPKLVLPAIATEPMDHVVADEEIYHRPAGQLLQPDRDSMEALEEIRRQVGSRVFAAQYQQNPSPPDGNLIKAAWLKRYQVALDRTGYRHVVLSCDPAGKAGVLNDYTAITIAGVVNKELHLLQVVRGHWSVLQMRDQISALAQQWKPDLVLIEDTSSGMGLIQLLREQTSLSIVGRHPKDDKETRMCRHQGRFEAARVLLPVEAPWLADFESELLSFPSGRYDDQVDAFMLLLDWFSQNEPNINVTWATPLVITRADMGLPPLIKDWSCSY
jgi:predicted phage terminase large subunit-like protein